ncbi:uncharacterized protein LOC122524431 [Polistes fuscatus]|uniref:uncharacterized protein LOC122524431 n=1 Tax=Polistes fuscatus TaxID=30207 RepID=UPI001CA90961|nr:uncharacterized protein LOC122524431 [Polistes fuscatus]XP_043502650.1 uncharacterized protein LOC122524431 [Polistes fuscatus]
MELITIELRPRLQSCTVFLFMKNSITLDEIKIKLLEANIMLSIGDNVTYITLPNIKIIPTSLSSLNVIDKWVCFRLHTQPSDSEFGSFQREVITNAKSQINNIESKKKILLKNSKSTILCKCCKNVLSKEITFQRVLPFPNIDFDPSEWFCSKTDINLTLLLHPNELDIFYGPFFAIVHSNILYNYRRMEKDILCNRCLLNIGIQDKNNSFKIWDCCIDYNLKTNQIIIQEASNPLDDFIAVIKSFIRNNTFGEIILECLLAKQSHYMVIKPMDMRLGILTEENIKSTDNKINLKESFVTKVLYKYSTDKIILSEDCINTKNYEVSLSMIEAGLDYLLLSTKRFPKHYKTVKDYYIGYINVE